jgi:hypothetical protein
MLADPAATERAMMEAALAELGGEIPEEIQAQLDAMAQEAPEASAPAATAPLQVAGPAAYLTFLIGLARLL